MQKGISFPNPRLSVSSCLKQMAIRCPKCGRRHDVVEFEEGREVRCSCGMKLDLSLIETVGDFERYFENEEEREKAREIQKDAQGICIMILDDRCAEVDVRIAQSHLEEKVKKYFPDKMQAYRMIYEARFKRLWDQFRKE